MTSSPSPPFTPIVMRPRDVAKRWQCSERAIYTLIEQKKLAYFRVGEKIIRILIADVEEYERQQLERSRGNFDEVCASAARQKQAADAASRLIRSTRPGGRRRTKEA